jgi:small subunit ribosomal protein S16
MATKIRLTRLGDKKTPFYRVVVADSRCARNGSYIENLGTYNPMVNPAEIKLNKERVDYWIKTGAQMSETAKELLVNAGIIEKKAYRAPKPKQMPPQKKEPKAEEAPAEEEQPAA